MFGKVFGANVDWISQHSVLPEYFRQQFYETGNLFPEFAANIGGGQNIYNFSYYGLYSPLILPSYLLPSVKMSDYIIAVSILCLVADVFLFYRWLCSNKVSKGNARLTSMMFLLAGPLIFHSYNQIMFVNYMPFLILGLIGVDRYFRRKKRGLLTISIFLMILTSFYFSIGGILILVIYGVYRYFTVLEERGEKGSWGKFLLEGLKFMIPVFTGILMSGILLVPTAMALMGGVREGNAVVNLSSLFSPDVKLERMLYSPYGVGLTTFAISVLLTGITYKKWREKYLHLVCVILLTIPFFMYLLNGGLYIRDKVLIPMLPLLCFLIALYLEKQRNQEIPGKEGILSFVVTIGIVWFAGRKEHGEPYQFFLIIEAVLMLACGCVFYWKKKEKILMIVSLTCLFLFDVGCYVKSDRMLDVSFYEKITDKSHQKQMEKILVKETGFYRTEQIGSDRENAANLNRIWSMEQYSSSMYSSTYNGEYQTFRQDTFHVEQPYRNELMEAQAKNPVFQNLMGVKYILSETEVPGYEKVAEGIYEKEEVLPIAYVTDRILPIQVYEGLRFPYNQTAFLDYAVAKEKKGVSKDEFFFGQENHVQQVPLRLDSKIETKASVSRKVKIPKAKKGDVLFLRFQIENKRPSEDVAIWVEGMRNKLTAETHIYYNGNEKFTYAIPLKEGQEEIKIKFGAGTYEICGLESYLWKAGGDRKDNGLMNEALCQGEFLPDKEETKGNVIVGFVEAKTEGYLITSIPYDENFQVYVDGNRVEHEKVNTAFLGAPVEKGRHKVKIVYHAPGAGIGKGMSALGGLLFLGLEFIQVRGRKKES